MIEREALRLLSCVYQPFVNVGAALLAEFEIFFANCRTTGREKLAGDFLIEAVELLASVIEKAKITVDDPPAGWPLCTDRYLLVHFGPLMIDTLDCAGAIGSDYLQNGDFFLVVDSDCLSFSDVRLTLFVYDSVQKLFLSRKQFRDSAQFCQWLERRRPTDQSIGDDDDDESIAFGRCLVRDGKSGDLRLIDCNQLFGCVGISASTSCCSPSVSLSDLPGTRIRMMEDSESVSLNLTSQSLSPIPKRIDDVQCEILSSGVVSFTGGRCQSAGQQALVEIRVAECAEKCNSVEPDELASALMYLYFVHRRSSLLSSSVEPGSVSGDHRLVILAKFERRAQENQERVLIADNFVLAVQQFLHRIPTGLKRIYLVADNASANAEVFAKTMSIENDAEKPDLVSLNLSALSTVASRSDLTENFGGDLSYDRKKWVDFRRDLEPFLEDCRNSAKNCVSIMQKLKGAYSDERMSELATAGASELENELNQLRCELASVDSGCSPSRLAKRGDANLLKIRDDYGDLRHVRSYREAVDKVGAFYTELQKVTEKVRRGIQRRIEILERCLKRSKFIKHTEKLSETMLQLSSEIALYDKTAEGARSSRIHLEEFETFCDDYIRPCIRQADEIVERVHIVDTFEALIDGVPKEHIQSTIDRIREVKDSLEKKLSTTLCRLQNVVICYEFLDKTYDWLLLAGNILNGTAESSAESDELQCLTLHLSNRPTMPPDDYGQGIFDSNRDIDKKLLLQLSSVREQCVDTERAIQRRIGQLRKTAADLENCEEIASASSSNLSDDSSIPVSDSASSVAWRRRLSVDGSLMSASSSSLMDRQYFRRASFASESCRDSTFRSEHVSTFCDDSDFTRIITEDLTGPVVSEISENTLRKKRAERCVPVSLNNLNSVGRKSWNAPPPSAVSLMSAIEKAKIRRPFRKLMKRSSTCDDIINAVKPSRHQSLESLPSISEEAVNCSALSSESLSTSAVREESDFKVIFRSHQMDVPPPFKAPLPCVIVSRIPSPPLDCNPNVRMQQMVVNELLQTEQAYVVSLRYVVEHYLSEMHRPDLPHQLLGQRLTVFGNIEKLLEFHDGQLLPELMLSCNEASDVLGLHVAKCFLKYQAKFHLYALYNKNKPKSDALMTECAAVFFRTKQLLLHDKLDLSSYLLKPVQRMGKYALLLQQLIKACPKTDQEQLDSLKAAEEMITFQLRHGNDLLAMDLIQRSDLNLKEQGQLLRQDEFIVYEGRHRRKCARRVFLFESLVLFTKPKRIRASNGANKEVYESKHSIKIGDVGMTEQVDDSGTKFELWMLRHTSRSRYVFLTTSSSQRSAWISDIRRLLWQQALVNREQRRAEMSSMGSNVCVELLSSKDRIEDRSLNGTVLSKSAKFRFSVLNFGRLMTGDSSNSFNKRPHSLISVGSTSSSSNSASSDSTYQSAATPTSCIRTLQTSYESGLGSSLYEEPRARSASDTGFNDISLAEDIISEEESKALLSD